jgi:hypothetical protein
MFSKMEKHDISNKFYLTYEVMQLDETRNQPVVIKPPFSEETARAKVKMAENAWNTHDPEIVVRGYTVNSKWRNRTEFFSGHNEIKQFLKRKWQKESEYKLEKELWAYTDNRISVRFEYEWKDAETGQWMRTHGNEHWEFDRNGLMSRRDMSANNYQILESERKFKQIIIK